MKHHGWVIYNGHLTEDKFLDYAQWIQKAGADQHAAIDIIKNNQLLVQVQADRLELIRSGTENRPEFVLFSDKDIPLARQLEYMDIPVFNCTEAIEISDNKISTYQILAKHHIPIPKTIIGPKFFPGVQSIDIPNLDNVVKELGGFPIVVKEAYGSFGEQVYLIHTKFELEIKIAEIKDKPFLLQQFISSSYGKDIRLNVVGNQVVASMLRRSSNDFRANVSAGGKMEAYIPSEREKQLAITATKAIGADFAGVDLLFGKGGPIVCEINSNAHIRNIYDCTGVNVADFMIEYVLKQIRKEKHNA